MKRPQEGEKFKVWIALMHGVYEIEVEQTSVEGIVNGPYRFEVYHKGAWHRTREEAEAKMRELVNREIASLKKQLVKLEKIVAGAE